MKPVQYSESVAIGDVRPHVGISTCLSVCEIPLQSPRRCKTGILVEPMLTPITFRVGIIVYKDSSRRRYHSVIHYEPRMRARHFQETCYVLPRPPPENSYASTSLDAAAAKALDPNGRRWYTTALKFDRNKELACGGMVLVDGGSGHVVSRDANNAPYNGDGGQAGWKGSSRGGADGSLQKSNGGGPQSTVIEVNVTPSSTNLGERIVIRTAEGQDGVITSDVNNNPDDDDHEDDDALVSNSYLIRWPSSGGGNDGPTSEGGPSTYRTRMKIDSGRNIK